MTNNNQEICENILECIEKRKGKSNIGTLTRIYSYCKKFTPKNNIQQKPLSQLRATDEDIDTDLVMAERKPEVVDKIPSGSSNQEIIEKVLKEYQGQVLCTSLDKQKIVDICKKALSLQRQENEKLENQLYNWRVIAERYEEALNEQRKEWIELSKKELASLQKKIEKYFKDKQKQMNEHIEQFGKGENRDIDKREKFVMTMVPIVYSKEISKIFQEKENV